MADSERLSVNLAPEVAEALRELAKKNGVSITEAVRRAISTEKFIEDVKDSGGKLLIEDPKDKNLRQLVFR